VSRITTFAKLKAKKSARAVGKPDIQSWVSATVPFSDMEESDQTFVWHREHVTDDWPQAMQYASKRLFTSRTGDRVHFLQQELLLLVKHEGMQFEYTLN